MQSYKAELLLRKKKAAAAAAPSPQGEEFEKETEKGHDKDGDDDLPNPDRSLVGLWECVQRKLESDEKEQEFTTHASATATGGKSSSSGSYVLEKGLMGVYLNAKKHTEAEALKRRKELMAEQQQRQGQALGGIVRKAPLRVGDRVEVS